MRFRLPALCVAVPLLLLLPLLAADPPAAAKPLPAPKGYVCGKATKALVIDGKLDDEAWKAAPWSDDFADIEGDAKPKPTHRTRMKMLWDDTALYIAAELDEPNVWATLKDHDSIIFLDPDFEVFLDPDGDTHDYGELEVNALNTTWDLFLTKPYRDSGRALHAWEIKGLKTAVHVNGTLNDPTDTDRGWTVEIAWPWAGLKEITSTVVPPKDGDRWKVNFSRVEWDTETKDGKTVKVKGKPEHNWVWSPQGVIDMHRPERWGNVQFTTKAVEGVKYTPDPAQAVKDRLFEIYYAEQEYKKKHGKYTTDTPVIGPNVVTTPHGFEATMRATKEQGGKTWTVTHDGRLTGE